eukprot:gene9920-12165_t
MSSSTNNDKDGSSTTTNQQQPVNLGSMTAEERSVYSIQRAPDYHGQETKVLGKSRNECWKAKDQYFECLDKNNENESMCKEFLNVFEQSCYSSWVDHFIKKRKVTKMRNQYLEKSN